MAGLSDLDEATPTGSQTPTQGDDHIRQVKQKVKEFAAAEHTYGGKHKIPVSAEPQVVDADAVGHLSVKTGTHHELFYDTGIEQKKLTSNSEVAALQSAGAAIQADIIAVQADVAAMQGDIADIQGSLTFSASSYRVLTAQAAPYPITIPDSITKALVEAWGPSGGGGGGGGGGGNNGQGSHEKPGMAGGGGGGGAYCKAIVTVTPGSVIDVYVGRKGTGGAAGTGDGADGTDGETTSFGAYLSISGGAKGLGGKDYDNGPTGGGKGAGGTVSNLNALMLDLLDGSDGTDAIRAGGGLLGGYTLEAGVGGAPGKSYYDQAMAGNGDPADVAGGAGGGKGGGGGGGAMGAGGAAGAAGGDGVDGFMIISW